jgi:hypothetical protein
MSANDPKRTLRASKENPRAYREQNVESRECQKQVRKHTGHCHGYEHSRDEYQSVDNGSGYDLSCAGTTSKHVKPTNYYDRETDYAHESFLMPNKSGIPKKRLGNAWPNNQQKANR